MNNSEPKSVHPHTGTANNRLSKIVIANRGEIACRIIHSARKLGIKTVAVYSAADINALHVELADDAFFIGEAAVKDSYLRADMLLDIAKRSGAQAIHPGYGFLSENADFARQCEDNNIIFIGPPAHAIDAMGLKSAAKITMEAANVPLVPGYHGHDQSIETLKQACIEIGFPVLLKASAGGGGKGMRVVESIDGIEEAITSAQREGLNYFADRHLLVEKYLPKPRHIEIQIFCDQQGNGVYLFERDCSIQRRHQKIIEEAPAPDFPPSMRKAMGETALQAAKAIGYVGAGTVEFLYENDKFYFMEMNTRLQVEHPVTEYISGQDLIAWQFKIAAGDPLPLQQSELNIRGHAIEVRLYAEDPENNFLPTTGHIEQFIYPFSIKTANHFALDYDSGLRMDTGIRSGDDVSPFYDPMIAKLIVWGEDRQEAMNKLKQTLHHTHITGIKNNIRYLERLINLPAFSAAQLTTHFIADNAEALFHASLLSESDQRLHHILCAWFLFQQRGAHHNQHHIASNDHTSPWNISAGWRLNSANEDAIEFSFDDEKITVLIQSLPSGKHCMMINGDHYQLLNDASLLNTSSFNQKTHEMNLLLRRINNEGNIVDVNARAQILNSTRTVIIHNPAGYSEYALLDRLTIPQTHDQDNQGLHAPMNGCLTEVRISAGDYVSAGTTLVIMEAMKMEHNIKAPYDGIIDQVFFQQGDLVDEGTDLLSFKEQDKNEEDK